MHNVLEKLRAADRSASMALAYSPVSPSAPPTQAPTEQASGFAGSTHTRSDALTLTPKERDIHDHGLVSLLKQRHDDLDAAVFAAYGWPTSLTDAEILDRLVTLNAQRAEEEARGIIHWLRPEYQNAGKAATQDALSLPAKAKAESRKQKANSLGRSRWGNASAPPSKPCMRRAMPSPPPT